MENNSKIIQTLIDSSGDGVTEIKLKILLQMREKISAERYYQSSFPPLEIGSITLVDQVVLLSLLQLIKPKNILEVGTYLGYTTSLLANNSKEALITTIDLPGQSNEFDYNENQILVDGDENDNFLRSQQHNTGSIYIDALTQRDKERITLVKADSTSISFKKEFVCSEFVFIDGGHDYVTLASDTKNARALVQRGVIIWHDFGSNIHNEVSSYLKNEQGRKIFHVLGSLCAFEFIGF